MDAKSDHGGGDGRSPGEEGFEKRVCRGDFDFHGGVWHCAYFRGHQELIGRGSATPQKNVWHLSGKSVSFLKPGLISHPFWFYLAWLPYHQHTVMVWARGQKYVKAFGNPIHGHLTPLIFIIIDTSPIWVWTLGLWHPMRSSNPLTPPQDPRNWWQSDTLTGAAHKKGYLLGFRAFHFPAVCISKIVHFKICNLKCTETYHAFRFHGGIPFSALRANEHNIDSITNVYSVPILQRDRSEFILRKIIHYLLKADSIWIRVHFSYLKQLLWENRLFVGTFILLCFTTLSPDLVALDSADQSVEPKRGCGGVKS